MLDKLKLELVPAAGNQLVIKLSPPPPPHADKKAPLAGNTTVNAARGEAAGIQSKGEPASLEDVFQSEGELASLEHVGVVFAASARASLDSCAEASRRLTFTVDKTSCPPLLSPPPSVIDAAGGKADGISSEREPASLKDVVGDGGGTAVASEGESAPIAPVFLEEDEACGTKDIPVAGSGAEKSIPKKDLAAADTFDSDLAKPSASAIFWSKLARPTDPPTAPTGVTKDDPALVPVIKNDPAAKPVDGSGEPPPSSKEFPAETPAPADVADWTTPSNPRRNNGRTGEVKSTKVSNKYDPIDDVETNVAEEIDKDEDEKKKGAGSGKQSSVCESVSPESVSPEPTSTPFGFGFGFRSGFGFGKFCSSKLLCIVFSIVVLGLGCSAFILSSYGSGGVSEPLDSVPGVAAIPISTFGLGGATESGRAQLFAPTLDDIPPPDDTRVVIKYEQLSSRHSEFKVLGPTPPDVVLNLKIGIAHHPPGVKIVEEIVRNTSTVGHPHFAKHPPAAVIQQHIFCEKGNKKIRDWLTAAGCEIIGTSGTYLTASATVAVWEGLLATEFVRVQELTTSDPKVHTVAKAHVRVNARMAEYLAEVVGAVELPLAGKQYTSTTCVDDFYLLSRPDKLREVYGIPEGGGDPSVRLAIVSRQPLEKAGIQTFINVFAEGEANFPNNLRIINVSPEKDEEMPDCVEKPGLCTSDKVGEVQLDVSTALGISPKSSIEVVYFKYQPASVIFDFLLNQTDGPPDVLSYSYGIDVGFMPPMEIKRMNEKAAALTAAGTTIVVASGDGGARGMLNPADVDSDICEALSVMTPALSENVVAVGATQLPFQLASGGGGKEQAATCTRPGLCKGGEEAGWSGGGFFDQHFVDGRRFHEQAVNSWKEAMPNVPEWQKDAIETWRRTARLEDAAAYLAQLRGSDSFESPLRSRPAPNGRGVPDVAMSGLFFPIFIGSSVQSCMTLHGTSASAPLFAAMVANAKAKLKPEQRLGFINRAMYNRRELFNDVTEGGNQNGFHLKFEKNCAGLKGAQYWSATKGWDPVTGLGSITQNNLQSIMTLAA